MVIAALLILPTKRASLVLDEHHWFPATFCSRRSYMQYVRQNVRKEREREIHGGEDHCVLA